jgi:hypothetical protein
MQTTPRRRQSTTRLEQRTPRTTSKRTNSLTTPRSERGRKLLTRVNSRNVTPQTVRQVGCVCACALHQVQRLTISLIVYNQPPHPDHYQNVLHLVDHVEMSMRKQENDYMLQLFQVVYQDVKMKLSKLKHV